MKNLSVGLLILRFSTGILFMLHGIAKVQHGVSGIGEKLASKGLPAALSYGAYIGEIVAPLMIILGFRTRIGALLICFTMLVAVLTSHVADLTQLSNSGGWKTELQALYFFNALTLFFTGAGAYAVSRNNRWD